MEGAAVADLLIDSQLPNIDYDMSSSVHNNPYQTYATMLALLCLVVWLAAAVAQAAGATQFVDEAARKLAARQSVTEHERADSLGAEAVKTVNISAAEAAHAARSEYGGRILGVNLEEDVERPYYRVKLLRNGQLRVVYINAHHERNR
ncbi:MAG TPA: PepSY domain-containing protein [Salinisphaeraceae bacterium]|nr:PepSY domain-containing protein [Salinisphaeraceae bacterium]